MMPSIGVSAADSTSQAAGGSPIFNPQHLFGRGNQQTSRNTTSWSPTTTSEATAKTDMGGGLLGGLGGGGSGGGGLGGILGSLGSGLGKLLGGRSQPVLDGYDVEGQPVYSSAPASAGALPLILLAAGLALAGLVLWLIIRD